MHDKWIQLIQALAMAVVPMAILRPVPVRKTRIHRRRISRLMEL